MSWSTIPRNPPASTLRWFGVYAILCVGSLTVWQYNRENWTVALVLLGLAVLTGAAVVLHPRLLRPSFVGMTVAAYPLNWLVSHSLLALIYFGLFTPLSFLFRILGRDLLGIRTRPKNGTYWAEKPPVRDVRKYFRQS